MTAWWTAVEDAGLLVWCWLHSPAGSSVSQNFSSWFSSLSCLC